MDFIVVHGSPGSGKTTISRKLHESLKCPWFEFGWIPEFRMLNPHNEMTGKEEEEMSFENLILVCRNYIKHGFENILLSDLMDKRMLDIPISFAGNSYIIFTLYSENNDVIRERILNRENGNTYRNFEEAMKINSGIRNRATLPNEHRIRTDHQGADGITRQILSILERHEFDPVFCKEEYDSSGYFSYTD